MNKKSLFSIFVLGIIAIKMDACVGASISTTPIGYVNIPIPGGGATSILGLNLTSPPSFVGRAATVEANLVTLSGIDLTQRLTAGRSYALLVTSGANVGVNTLLISWTQTQLTILDDLSGLLKPAQDTFELIPLPTVSEIFGVGGNLLSGGSAGNADLIMVRHPSTGEELRLYYSTGGFSGVGWRAVGKGSIDYVNLPIYLTDGVSIQKKSAGSGVLELTGSVQIHQVADVFNKGSAPHTSIYAVGVTLSNSGFFDAGNPDRSLFGGTADSADLISFDSDQDGVLETYYFSNGGAAGIGWRRFGSGDASQDNISVPSGFFVSNKSRSVQVQRVPPY